MLMWVIVGVAIAVFVVLVLFILSVCCCCFSKNKRKRYVFETGILKYMCDKLYSLCTRTIVIHICMLI